MNLGGIHVVNFTDGINNLFVLSWCHQLGSSLLVIDRVAQLGVGVKIKTLSDLKTVFWRSVQSIRTYEKSLAMNFFMGGVTGVSL